MVKRILITVFFLLLAVSLTASQADEFFDQGNTAYKAKDYSKAFELFQKAVRLEPETAKYQYNLGLAARKLNKYSMAAEAFQEAEWLDPGIGFTSDKAAFREKLEEMIRLSDGVSREGSGAKEFAAGEAAYKSGDYKGAYASFAKAVAKQPVVAKYQYNLGLACRKLDKYAEAFRAFEEARAIDPEITFTNKKEDFLAKLDEMRELAGSTVYEEQTPAETTGNTGAARARKNDDGTNIFLWILGLIGGGAAIWTIAKKNKGQPPAQGAPRNRKPPGSRTGEDGYDNRYTNYTPGRTSGSHRDRS